MDTPTPAEPTDTFDAKSVAREVTQNYAVDRPQVAKVSYTHDAMVDLLIANPGISQSSVAKYFGYTQAWVCTIMASDAFQVKLAQRRHELVDPEIAASVEERFKALATVSVNKLLEHMSRPAVEVDPEIMIKAAALGAKALGIGGNAPPQVHVRSSEERLESLAGRLTNLNKHLREGVVDVQINEIKSPSGADKSSS